jgi:hypothetical protein
MNHTDRGWASWREGPPTGIKTTEITMRVGQMYPKRTLDAEDLNSEFPQGCVVTIESLDYRTDAGEIGEPEITYFLKCQEFRKPIRMNKTSAQTIEQVLGSDETDDWIGRTITIHGLRKKITDRDTGKPKQIWVIDVDMVAPRTPPQIKGRNTDITGIAAARRPRLNAGPSAATPGVIGADVAIKIAQSLHIRGKNMGDLATHLNAIGLSVAGLMPPMWPSPVLAASRTYTTNLPKVAEPMPQATWAALLAAWGVPTAPAPESPEVIDRTTGAVITPAPAAAAEPKQQQMPPDHQEIREEDIPF